MTSDLCTDDVVVHITTPHTISSEPLTGPAGGTGSRVATSSAAVELGRRLLLAARAGDTALVLDLMAKGAPFTTDWLGTSALHLAAGNAHTDTCAVLLRAGVSRDARTKVERSALHVAAAAGHSAVVRLLLGAGADPHARDMLRMTPLHWAVQRGDAATVVELLAHGADPTAVSKFNKTPRSLAAQLHREDLLKLIDDAIREREAANSVQHLVNQQNMTEAPIEQVHLQTLDGIQRLQNIKTYKIKSEKEKTPKVENKSEGDGLAAQLLRRHGITLLPADHSCTVLSALQSGRSVVLSDAGKLMLKESSECTEPVVSKSPAPAPSSMVLTATPVKSPPKPGIKIFTLNNKLIAKQKDINKIPVKKIINPQDMQQVKLVQLSPDAKLLSSPKLKPVRRLGSVTSPITGVGGGTRPAVKIIMNKSNFTRLVQNATRAEDTKREGGATGEEAAGLRAALAASRRALAALQHELGVTRARLARYEPHYADPPTSTAAN